MPQVDGNKRVLPPFLRVARQILLVFADFIDREHIFLVVFRRLAEVDWVFPANEVLLRYVDVSLLL